MSPALMFLAVMFLALMSPAVMFLALMFPAVMSHAVMFLALMFPAVMSPAVIEADIEIEHSNFTSSLIANTPSLMSFSTSCCVV